ncbi:hypothetical protein FRC11_006810 [Ceratobasidium sp. 423]|nr:hypothetical protein FRC11_006810 [Ceratobasidium sp. 423]
MSPPELPLELLYEISRHLMPSSHVNHNLKKLEWPCIRNLSVSSKRFRRAALECWFSSLFIREGLDWVAIERFIPVERVSRLHIFPAALDPQAVRRLKKYEKLEILSVNMHVVWQDFPESSHLVRLLVPCIPQSIISLEISYDEPPAPDSCKVSPAIHPHGGPIAICHAPRIRISGLHFHSQLKITEKMESYLLTSLEQHGYFARPGANQIMLFGRPRVTHAEQSSDPQGDRPSNQSSGLPDFLERLVEELEKTLSGPEIPPGVRQKLFSPVPGQARQAILNRYNPGEGIKPHIDLPNRFADGIIIVSLASGIVMDFAHESKKQAISAWLPPRSIVIMEGEARWEWTHGIAYRESDLVDVTGVEVADVLGVGQHTIELPDSQNVVEIPRQLRTSITLRWMLPGANVVGA